MSPMSPLRASPWAELLEPIPTDSDVDKKQKTSRCVQITFTTSIYVLFFGINGMIENILNCSQGKRGLPLFENFLVSL